MSACTSPHAPLVAAGFEEELVDEDDEDVDVDEVELENWTQKVKNWWDFGADGERCNWKPAHTILPAMTVQLSSCQYKAAQSYAKIAMQRA